MVLGKRCNTLEPNIVMAYFLANTGVEKVKFTTPSKKRNDASKVEELRIAKKAWIGTQDKDKVNNAILKANGFAEPVDAGGAIAGGAVAGGAVAGGAVAINLDLSDDDDEVVGDVATNLADTLRLAADVVLADNVEDEGDKKA